MELSDDHGDVWTPRWNSVVEDADEGEAEEKGKVAAGDVRLQADADTNAGAKPLEVGIHVALAASVGE